MTRSLFVTKKVYLLSILAIKVSKLPTMHPIYGYNNYDIVECVRISAKHCIYIYSIMVYLRGDCHSWDADEKTTE